MAWPQALLGERDNPIVRQQLGISSVPIYYVIDPQGKLIHRSFQLHDAVDALHALERLEPERADWPQRRAEAHAQLGQRDLHHGLGLGPRDQYPVVDGQVEGAERVSYASSFVRFGSDIEFELAHQEESELIAAADALKARLAAIDGVGQVEDSFDLGKRQLLFELTAAGRAAGLRPADVAVQVRQAFFGEEVQRIQRGREEVRVYVRYPENSRASLEALDAFRVQLPDGGRAPLFTVARVEESRAYSSIRRVDGRRVVTVSADVDEAVTTPNIANETIIALMMPELEQSYPGLRWVRAGATREQNEDLAALGSAFIVVLLVIFALIATQLRSYLQPLAILVSIPLGVAGAVLGHLVLGFSLSFISIFGIVALAGVAVNASVVLVDLYNTHRRAGKSPVDAAAAASARRFRPVVLTTLTTALGLAPLLFETSPQAQFLIPMAVSLGFGIVVSGFMVLFVTPAVAVIIEDLRRLVRARDPNVESAVPADLAS